MSNSGNTSLPEADFTTAENMAAFDRLPVMLRLALHDSPINWSAAAILHGMRKQGVNAAYVLGKLREQDQLYLDRVERSRR